MSSAHQQQQQAPPSSPLLHQTSIRYGKNKVLTESGKSPWYDANGVPRQSYVIGVAGGSASGKTSVARAIVQSLRNVPWLAIVSQDSFYKSLSKEQSKLAFENNYDFDHPNAFDYDILYECIQDLKQSRAVEMPVYSFVEHQRTSETQYMYGASVIILEGIFVLHDPAIRQLLDLKIFVQADSDLMLARRIKRDMVERGRDVQGILEQYLRFVKPSMDNFVQPTSKYADIIVPGQNNTVAIDVITQQIRRQLEMRDEVRLRHALSLTPATPRREIGSPFDSMAGSSDSSAPYSASDRLSAIIAQETSLGHPRLQLPSEMAVRPYANNHPLESELPPNVHVLSQTPQLRALLTVMHDLSVTGEDFVFTIDRLATLIMEESMAFLPYRSKSFKLASNDREHVGTQLAVDDICSVAILRSGTVLESSARRVLPALARGSILIQSQADGEARLYTLDLPKFLKSRQRATNAWVLLLDSQIGTGAAALMAIRVLLDHGVKEEHILFCCLLVSVKGGVHALHRAFPRVRIVVAGVDPDLRRSIVREAVPARPLMHNSKRRNDVNGIIPPIALDGTNDAASHRHRTAMADDVAYDVHSTDDDDVDVNIEQHSPLDVLVLDAGQQHGNNRLSSTMVNKASQTRTRRFNAAATATSPSSSSAVRSRVCFAICPGAGNIGDRYFGTTARGTSATNNDTS